MSNQLPERSPSGRVIPIAICFDPPEVSLYFWTPSDAHEFLMSQAHPANFKTWVLPFRIEYASWEGITACRVVFNSFATLRL